MSKTEEPAPIFKKAENIRRGDIVKVADKEETVQMVGKLFNPGNRLQIINVSLVFKDQAPNTNIAVFPPSEQLEVVNHG